ncbi:MAG: hypothetical protein BWY70_00861 [Bacteroidetes bacterium ADurb.Bin408]|nr:MAG: hypothetical protein BWY70_00861 [Bacteroidetes bacterium ADurb.Bin408]
MMETRIEHILTHTNKTGMLAYIKPIEAVSKIETASLGLRFYQFIFKF